MKFLALSANTLIAGLLLTFAACQKSEKVESVKPMMVEKAVPALAPGTWLADKAENLPPISLTVAADNRLTVTLPNSTTSGTFSIDAGKEPAVLTFIPDEATGNSYQSQIRWIDAKTVTMTYPSDQSPSPNLAPLTFRQQ